MHDSGTYALHRLLSAAREKASNGITWTWANTLEAVADSDDFARKMSEVGVLLDETLRAVDAIDDPRSRAKYHRYTHGWWAAVYQPHKTWNTGASDEEFVAQVHLDQLDSLAEYLTERSPRPAEAPSPTDTEMQQLREDCDGWLAWLNSLGDAQLPKALRHQLAENFRQALWLIDNAHLFGPLHAAAQVRRAADATLLETPVHLPRAERGRLTAQWQVTAALVATLVVPAAQGTAEFVNNSLSAVKTGIEIVEMEGRKQLPAAPSPDNVSPADIPRQLEDGETQLTPGGEASTTE